MSARRRLVLGVLGVGATAVVVRRDRVGHRELHAFRAVNDLPDALYRPLWLVMQAGALGASPVAGVAALCAGRPRLARRLLLSGSGSWLLAKGVKRLVQRPRPVVLVDGARCRGPAATGLGYLSGHAAVSAALASAALPHLGPRGRLVVLLVLPAVSAARVHVGAHLPLDVVGGAALGVAADAVLALAGQ